MQAAPAYHMRIKDLMLAQKAEYLWVARTDPQGLMAIYHKHQHDLAALRQQHRDVRARAKAEKAFLAPSKLEPNFWFYYPNHDGRLDTMINVLVALGQPKEQATEIMPTYAAWLLTANKMHANGRPMNRWALMTMFVETQLMEAPPAHELVEEPLVEQILVEVPLVDAHPSLLE